jgi:hypothetical protein
MGVVIALARPWPGSSPSEFFHRFLTGKELDADYVSNLRSPNQRYHFPARFYLPFRGSFSQIDPSFITPLIIDPGSRMRTYNYIYAFAAPAVYVDPTGELERDFIPTSAWNAKWSLRNTATLFGPGRRGLVVIYAKKVSCNCNAPNYDMCISYHYISCKITLHMHIYIDSEWMVKEGVYGHEQYHVENDLNLAEQVAKWLESQERIYRIGYDFGPAPDSNCKIIANRVGDEGQDRLNNLLSGETHYPRFARPIWGQYENPRGGFDNKRVDDPFGDIVILPTDVQS